MVAVIDEQVFEELLTEILEVNSGEKIVKTRKEFLKGKLWSAIDRIFGTGNPGTVDVAGYRVGRSQRSVGQWDSASVRAILGQDKYDNVSEWQQVLNPDRLEAEVRAGNYDPEQAEKLRAVAPGKSLVMVVRPLGQEREVD